MSDPNGTMMAAFNHASRPAARLPRYSALALCVRAAIYGPNHPLVQHMARRNHELAERDALERALAAMQVLPA